MARDHSQTALAVQPAWFGLARLETPEPKCQQEWSTTVLIWSPSSCSRLTVSICGARDWSVGWHLLWLLTPAVDRRLSRQWRQKRDFPVFCLPFPAFEFLYIEEETPPPAIARFWISSSYNKHTCWETPLSVLCLVTLVLIAAAPHATSILNLRLTDQTEQVLSQKEVHMKAGFGNTHRIICNPAARRTIFLIRSS